MIKFKVSTTYEYSQNITINIKSIENTTGTGNYILYSCSSDNYTGVRIDALETDCTNIGSGLLPIAGNAKRTQNNASITISAGSTNYYILYVNTISSDKTFYGTTSVNRYVVDTITNKILAAYTPVADNIASTYVTNATGINFAAISSSTNGQGLYINSKGSYYSAAGTSVVDPTAGTIKYFRGNVNNYVSFAGKTWRVMRINADGSIRLIDNDLTLTSIYNSTPYNSVEEAYIGTATNFGYTYNDSNYNRNDGNPGTSSAAKTALDNWYNTNLSAYSSYIVTGEYCNDVFSGTAGYGTWARNYTYKTPSFHCPTDSKKYGGNYQLSIGMITADDVAYAGGVVYTANVDYYLYKNALEFTMSPHYMRSWPGGTLIAYIMTIAENGRIYDEGVNSSSVAIRAVINIAGSTLATGKGTMIDPWEVQ